MSKTYFLNIALFIFVVMLASIIYLSEEKNLALKKLTGNDLSDINSINIQHNKNSTTIIKQKDGQWQITQPINIAANNFRIKSILKLINAPIHNQYSLAEIDRKTTGLEQPQTSIKFNDLLIEFGITNPVTKLRYVKFNNFVYTIEDVYYPLINSHFGTLVSLNILPAGSNIEKLVLLNQTISKDDKGLWQSNSEISTDNIIDNIDHWQHDQAFGVHEYLPRKELGKVFIYLNEQQQPLAYTITDTEPWLIIARPEIGLEYHLDKEAYDKLIAPQ